MEGVSASEREDGPIALGGGCGIVGGGGVVVGGCAGRSAQGGEANRAIVVVFGQRSKRGGRRLAGRGTTFIIVFVVV